MRSGCCASVAGLCLITSRSFLLSLSDGGPEQIDTGAGRFPADQLEIADRADLSELAGGVDSDFAEPAAALRAEIAERFEVFVRCHGWWPPAVVGRGRGQVFGTKRQGVLEKRQL